MARRRGVDPPWRAIAFPGRKADIPAILRRSEELHGKAARTLTAAMRHVAADPEGPSTVDRAELVPGIRSLNIRHSRAEVARRRSRTRCM